MSFIKITVNSNETLQHAQSRIAELWNEKKWLQISFNFDKQRSEKQNSALHVYCKLLANAMNDAGYPLIIKINGKETEVDWCLHSVKNYIWRPVQKAINGKHSSKDGSTKDYPEIYENINRHTASKLGINVPWPTRAEQ